MMKSCPWMAALALLGACGSEDGLVGGMDAATDTEGEGGEAMKENRPPVSGNDSAETFAGALVDIDVLENDGDPDGDSLDIDEVTQGDHGSVTIRGNEIRYTPTDGIYVGSDTFTYTVSDGNGGSDGASVDVTIIELPTIVILTPADNATISEPDITVTFAVTGCTFSQPPNNPTDGCHAHKFLDGAGYPATGGIGQYTVGPIAVTGLAVGTHVFRLALAVNDGSDALWVPAVEDEVSFTIGCAVGVLNPANGHCYEDFNDALAVDWLDASAACVLAGGHLATISDADENTFVNVVGGGDRWMGFNDISVEGTFVWTTGEPVTYTNWTLGEPDNNSGFQHCGRIASSGEWADEECNAETGVIHGYVCEYE